MCFEICGEFQLQFILYEKKGLKTDDLIGKYTTDQKIIS